MRILQIIDSLEIGGAERMAVNYANVLNKHVELSALCATRFEGPLKNLINDQVPYIFLNKEGRFDLRALFKMRNFIRLHKIDTLQAHGSSYFIASMVKLITPGIKLIWHDHYGKSEFLETRNKTFLKVCAPLFNKVFAVNEQLKRWATTELKVKKVYYIRNFISEALALDASFKILGKEGKRIVCVANFREQKNHHFLLDSFLELVKKDREVSLHLFGAKTQSAYCKSIFDRLSKKEFQSNVFYYGTYLKMSAILPRFDFGVLVSDSEGLPLSLLEYGQAGLPVIATEVGQCRTVVGNTGSIIAVNDLKAFVNAIEEYMLNVQLQYKHGQQFKTKIEANYGESTVITEVLSLYD